MNSMKPLCLAFAAELAELAQPQFSNRTNVSKKELFTSKALGLGGERTHKETMAKQVPGVLSKKQQLKLNSNDSQEKHL